MILYHILALYGKKSIRKLKDLLTVIIIYSDLLAKDPNKRMKIEEVLEHAWFSKVIKTNRTEERRKSREGSISSFKIYSTADN